MIRDPLPAFETAIMLWYQRRKIKAKPQAMHVDNIPLVYLLPLLSGADMYNETKCMECKPIMRNRQME
jgi:hypothetical protein